MKKDLVALIEVIPEIEAKFRKFVPAEGEFIYDVPEFIEWKQAILYELQDIYDRTHDTFVWKIINATGIIHKFNGRNGNERKYFNELKAEFERIDDTCYINVPGTCRIRFCEEMPNDRDLIIDAVAARYDNRPDDRYSIANAPLTQLEHIYSSIDNGKTVQISIITDSGEQLLLVHGYDRLGNLIAANCDSLSDAGKISIKVKAQVFWDGQKITMRSWFDFEWGELSSANGDVITVF